MKRKTITNVILIIIGFICVIFILIPIVIQPVIKSKIESTLSRNKDFRIEVEKVGLSFIPFKLDIRNITIHSNTTNIHGKIESVKINAIKPIRALLKKEYEIGEVSISNVQLSARIPTSKGSSTPIVLSSNVRMDKVTLHQINLTLTGISQMGEISIKDGDLRLHNVNVPKGDTLSPNLIRNIGFQIKEFSLVTPDSFYTFKAQGLAYNDTAKKLSLNNFVIHPNYPDYEFTARHKYQTDRIEAQAGNINIYQLSADTFFSAQRLRTSYLEIEKADLRVFRDRRKEFKHVRKLMLQELISQFPYALLIDSLGLLNSNITYVEHAEKANEPGKLTFKNAKAKIYNITNDKDNNELKPFLELHSNALLMGKGIITIFLKAKLFDAGNSFFMRGSLSGMDVKEFNSLTSKSAFLYLSSGRIDTMSFSFVADKTRATGNITFCYRGLNLTVINKHTNDTTALKEKFLTFITNAGIIDSNPMPGEPVREGVIDYKRDPERFIFNYCAKALMTGIKSSTQKPRKTFLKKVFGTKE